MQIMDYDGFASGGKWDLVEKQGGLVQIVGKAG
jgi:hypothetical protein